MKPRVIAIIQARMSSTRLPGKVLLDLGGRPVLDRMIERVKLAKTVTDLFISMITKVTGLPALINVQRVGATNIVITQMNGQWFKKSGIEFDRILVDAPCSGTGTIRKSFKTPQIWNQNMVRRLSGTQKQLIETGFSILKKGGILVYSTCTLEPEGIEKVHQLPS